MKKKTTIIFLILLSIFILISIISKPIAFMDDIWNYSFASNLSKGLLPYKDFNVIVTPLSFILNSLPLYIYNSFITFKFMYFIYYFLLIFLIHKISTKLKIKKLLEVLCYFLVIPTLLFNSVFDYNFIQMIFVLLLIYLSLCNKDNKDKRLNIISALIVGLSITNKQSTGVFILIAYIFLLFNKKKNILFIFKQLLWISIPILLMFLYLLVNNILKDFIDLTVLGLLTFSNKSIDLFLLIVLLLALIIMIIITYKNKKDYSYKLLLVYFIASLGVLIPLLDLFHFVLIIIIPILFIFKYLNNKVDDIDKSYIYGSFILIFIIGFTLYGYIDSYKIDKGIFKYNSISENNYKNIKSIDKYIINSDKNVYILDYRATLYKMNIDRYDKYFDLFNNGNFGYYGIDRMKKIIDNEDAVFLIDVKDNSGQKSEEIIDYVINKYVECGKIETFNIYCKNNK